MKYLASLMLSLLLVMPSYGAKLQVVTSFSILQDLVKQVGGDHVHVDNIVGPNEDAHVFNPAPQHGVMLARAQLVFVNGLGFEGWLDRLVKASGFEGNIVSVTDGIKPIVVNNTPDPHCWHSIPLAMIYVDNISKALQAADPANAREYQKNATAFKQRLRLLNEWVLDEVSRVEPKRRKVITAHDAFQYFAAEYNIKFLSPQGVSTQAEATPEAVMAIIKLIKDEGIKTVFVENITNEKQMKMIRESTGARLGGTLYSDALSAIDGPASDYISLMRHNVLLIISSMNGYSG